MFRQNKTQLSDVIETNDKTEHTGVAKKKIGKHKKGQELKYQYQKG